MKTTKSQLSLPILISLVVGNMIGCGIYMLPASLAAFGSISIFSWAYTSVGAIFLALMFSALNKRIPKTGGPYVFCKAAFGDFAGLCIAYIYWISLWVASAGIAVSSIGYLGFISPTFDTHSATYNPKMAFLVEAAAVWLFTGINILGIRTAGIFQLFLTILKLLPLILITLIGFTKINPHYFAEFNVSGLPNFYAMTSAAALTLWAFLGLETATVPADHTRHSKDVFKATVYGTIIAAIIYISSSLVLFGLIPPSILKGSQFPFADGANLLFGHNVAYFIALCAIISGLGGLNVNIMVQAQIPMAASRDQLFPSYFKKLSKWETPVNSQIISSVFVTVLLGLTINSTLIEQFNMIALIATLLTLVAYFVSALAELKLSLSDKVVLNKASWFKSVLIAILAASYSCWMFTGVDKKTVLYCSVLLFFIVPLYLFFRNKKKLVLVK